MSRREPNQWPARPKWSRVITVDGVEYYWRVRRDANIYDAGDTLCFAVVWKPGVRGRKLLVWPDKQPEFAGPPVVLAPRQVADAIRRAVESGWPASKPPEPPKTERVVGANWANTGPEHGDAYVRRLRALYGADCVMNVSAVPRPRRE